MLDWIQVQSSVISAVQYKDTSLYIRFSSGKVYQYEHVPNIIYRDFLQAPSLGQYFNQYIKGRYPYKKL